MFKLINKDGIIIYQASEKERFYKVVQKTLQTAGGSYKIFTKDFKKFILIY